MSKSTNVHWHSNAVSCSDRAALNGHSACCVWLTGLSGSGKSTVSVALERELVLRRGVHARVLDGDNVRHGLCSDLGFGPNDRRENIRRVGEVAGLFVDAGVVVIAAFISPCRADRDRIRSIIAGGQREDDTGDDEQPHDGAGGTFIEVHVDCPLEECERRDVKGLYKKARAGEIPDFTGISAPFEAPLQAEITTRTAEQTPEESAAEIVRYLEEKNIIPPMKSS